jgi:ring-1,2-phenylacetyl-CoA epoxidase subunit PaaE
MSASTVETRPVPVLGLPDPGERVPRLAAPTVALYLGTLALFAVEMYGFLAAGWPLGVTVAMGIAVTFLMFSVAHDSTHHAISTNTRVNDFFGHISMPFFVAWGNFRLLKFIHIEHHRNTNEVKTVDPDAWCEEGPWWQLPLRWATVDLWYLVFYVRRIKDRPRAEVALTFAVFAGFWIAVAALTSRGYGSELVWGYFIPQRAGIVILAWWFDYLPHNGLTATQREDRYRATRVRVGAEGLLTPLFVYQNYHLVHHLHPSVPFYRYVRAWRRNEQAYLDRNAAISTWFGRSLSISEYRTWRRLTEQFDDTGHRPTFFTLRVSQVDRLTGDSVAITFDVPDDLASRFQYLQGQHVTVRAIVDGQEVRRSYSLVEPVSAQTIRIAVRQVERGALSTYLNQDVMVGDLLDVMTPTGQFWVDLEPSSERSYVGVAAGSGITVMMSTIATTLEVEPESRFTLIYGNRTTDSTMFRGELDEMVREAGGRLTVHHVLSRDPDSQLSSRITVDLVHRLVVDPASVHAWLLCGPEQLVEELREYLTGKPGIVLSELFRRESTDHADISVDLVSDVTVTLDGVDTELSVRSTGDPILDAALQAGLDAPYSCAGGACGTCRARVLLGRAVMDQNHVLTVDDVENGYVLTCQAHPVTKKLRIDYS